MISCHECGSDVAEDTVFCPYCGISLEPVAIGETKQDESLDSTIMMPPSEISKVVEAESKAASGAAAAKEATETAASDENEIPTPSILRGVSKTSDNISVRQTSGSIKTETGAAPAGDEKGAEALADETEEVPNTQSEPVGEVSWDDDGFGESRAEPESVEIEEPESTEKGAGAVSEIEAATKSVGADETVSVLTTAETEAPEIEPETDEASLEAATGSAQEEAPAAAEAESVTAEPAQETGEGDGMGEPPKDAGIARPHEELEQADAFSAKPIFDSVRIMEDNDPYAQDFVATRLGSPKLGEEQSIDAMEDAGVAGSAARSGTTPGIGTTDTDGRSSKKLKPLSEGTVLNGRYEIIRKIGGGGMGAVYLASDNNLGGVLRAVKEMVQMHIEDAMQEKAVNDFKRESMILSSLDHVSIPTIFDYFYDDAESRFYLVMKYISGGDLASRLRAAPEGKLDELTVTEWAIQIIDVLDYLHNQPSTIVYRDLKPSNIMIDGNSGRIMLIDFGIARSIGQQQEKGVTAVGTMGYAPPELFSGNVEPRSDIYSLGSTMFHLLTGADPQSNPLLIFDFHKNPRPRQINPRISDQMEQILIRSVEYNADARFASAAEMRAVLAEHLAMLKEGRVSFGVVQAPIALGLANQAAFCGFCGQQIIASDLFCAFCGSRQPIAQPGVAAAKPAVIAAPTAKLLIEGTSELNTPVYSLQKDQNLVGRRDPMSNIFPEIDLSKYDPQTKISRRHARIWRDGANYLVEDLGSSNGTMLASAVGEGVKLLPHKPQVLSHGDKLKIGDTTLHFVVG